MEITVKVIGEFGHAQALHGLGLSYGTTTNSTFPWFTGSPEYTKLQGVARTLCKKDGGHNKFLESMYIWLLVRAPRYWWQEADTYRISSKQSESTMHTLKRGVKKDDFEDSDVSPVDLCSINLALTTKQELYKIKGMLPESFMQQRVWCLSYKTLRNIIQQRHNHKLPHWQCFIKEVKEQIMHPEYLDL